MKPKLVYSIFAVCALLILGGFVWRNYSSKQITSSESTPVESTAPADPLVTNSDPSRSRDSTPESPTSSVALPNRAGIEIPPPNSSEAEKAEFLQSLGVPGERTENVKWPIRLYGQVLDEHDNPVPGVTISLDWNEPPPTQPEHADGVTDASGRFSIDAVTGRILRVSLEKAGYYASSSNRVVFEFAPDEIQAANNNPLLFSMRQKGPGADLITSDFGMKDYVPLKAPKDGTPVALDFFSGKSGDDGQLKISNIKPTDGRERSDWVFRISVPGGGLIEHHDEFPFEAPTVGYQPFVEFKFDKNSTNWVSGFKKDFYVVFGQPPKYGRVHVETDTFTSGAHIEYAINPNGEPYLEPKEKVIRGRTDLPGELR